MEDPQGADRSPPGRGRVATAPGGAELGVPIRVVLRAELVRLFIRHLPGLVSAGEEAIE